MLLPREPAPGQPLSPQWGIALLRYLRSITLQPSAGFLVRRGPYGTTLAPNFKIPAAKGGAAVASDAPYHPFQIIDTSDAETVQVQVMPGSLLSGFSATGAATIAGLSTDIEIVGDSLIYLYYDSSTGYFTVAEESLSALSTWADYPDLVTLTGTPPEVDKWFLPIGYVGDTPADPAHTAGFPVIIGTIDYWVYQVLDRNLMLEMRCFDGTAVEYPLPWFAPGPAAP